MSKFQNSSKDFLWTPPQAPTLAASALQNRKSLFQKCPCNPEECGKGNAQQKESATFVRCLAVSEASIYQRQVSACSFWKTPQYSSALHTFQEFPAWKNSSASRWILAVYRDFQRAFSNSTAKQPLFRSCSLCPHGDTHRNAMTNGREADIRITFADDSGKCFCLLSNLVGIDDAVGVQCTNALGTFLRQNFPW